MFIEQLDAPFGCCDKHELSVLEQLIAQYYEQADSCMSGIVNKAFGYELFGKESEKEFNKLNNFHYLLIILAQIYLEKQNESVLLEKGTITELTTVEEWRDDYSLECYRKFFTCQGCNIMPLYSIFGLDWVNDPTDGIGYMYIQPGNTPMNRIS